MEITNQDLSPEPDFLSEVGDIFPQTPEQLAREGRREANARLYGEKFTLAKPMSDTEKSEFYIQRKKEKRLKARDRKHKQIVSKLDALPTIHERELYIQSLRSKKQKDKDRMATGKLNGTRIVFDCSFSLNMKTKEIKSAARQIHVCYGKKKKNP
jgi:hypothetical protein